MDGAFGRAVLPAKELTEEKKKKNIILKAFHSESKIYCLFIIVRIRGRLSRMTLDKIIYLHK